MCKFAKMCYFPTRNNIGHLLDGACRSNPNANLNGNFSPNRNSLACSKVARSLIFRGTLTLTLHPLSLSQSLSLLHTQTDRHSYTRTHTSTTLTLTFTPTLTLAITVATTHTSSVTFSVIPILRALSVSARVNVSVVWESKRAS